MTPACPLLLSVILSLRLAAAFDPDPSACSALASGVLYGAFSLQDLFPTIASGCSWTLENPDPTKYSLYLRFNRQEEVCTHFAPRLLPLDHYLVNFTCLRPSLEEAVAQVEPEVGRLEEEEAAGLELCGGSGPFTFLHFDKNFVQLCLSAEPSEARRLLAPAALAFRFVEVLLINNNNSSQFTCGVLCRWSEECGRAAGRACGFAQPSCSCPGEAGSSPATTTPPGPPAAHTLSNALVPGGPPPSAEADLHSGSSNDLFTTEMRYAFHEMCRDEYVMLMTWKKAAAGEIIYNKCPPNASGSASRRCLLSAQGVAYWGLPSFARCISHEYRYLYLSLREHLAKGQRMLAGEGMSQVVRSLQELLARRTYYSGDLLFSVDILRNVTDTFKRATYVPSADDVQRFFQVVSFMVDAENKDKWDDAQQVSPGSVHLLRVVEDFIHLVGDALKAFQSSLIVTDNLVISIQREPVSAVSSDITFPMRGRRGMKDWVRHSEDRLFLPKEVLSLSSPAKPAASGASNSPGRGKGPGTVPPGPGYSHQRLLPADPEDSSSYFVIGAVLYRTLGLILPPPRPPLAVTSRVMTVTVRPPTQPPAEPLITVELSYIINGTTDPHCASWDYSRADASSGDWDTESCQTLETQAAHTRCQCQHLSTFAVLAQPPKDLTLELAGSPSVPLVIGCAVSCMALLTLLAIYAAFWRFIKSERSIILLNFCLSILASNILILVGQSRVLSKGVCTMTAAFLHFFFLSSFCWVLTEAWQSYLAVIGRMRTRLVRKRFLCLGWGLPALVVAVSVGFTRTKGYGTSSYCWLSLEGGLLYAFVGPAAVIVLVNMLIGIVVFNKLMARDGISDKSKKQRAGSERCPWASLLLPCSACGAVPSPLLSSASARNAMASLWSSCVVLPLLALTWMSAVLAMTDRRSVLFQALFAVFNSAQGFVITAVHCFLRREVQDVVKCQMGVCRADESEDSPDSCKNGQLQILSDFEKDVDLACQTVLFKEVNTCNPSTITGTLSRLSLDEEEEPKSCLVGPEGGLSFSTLPGNILMPMAASSGLGEPPPPQEANPVYMCGEGSLRQLDLTWLRPGDPGSEGDYMVLPRRTLSLQPGSGGGGGEDPPRTRPEGTPRRAAKTLAHTEGYPSFLSVDHSGLGLGPAYGSLQNPYGMTFQPPPPPTPSARQVPEPGERSRTMPRTVPGSTMKLGSLERKKLRYSDLDFEKVMHTRKRHSELYHELNQKFHTFDRYRSQSTAKREKRWSVSSGGATERTLSSVSLPGLGGGEGAPRGSFPPCPPPLPGRTQPASPRTYLCHKQQFWGCVGMQSIDGGSTGVLSRVGRLSRHGPKGPL
ncbi:PREDICTED: adhesion G protein-coupled receptor B2 isoform X12 [Miniopterus natalensis]|uniref:adhesion G protein-coupled receptor B2 isoform X12 n=1 Tax=Miniopterus natalensis TaxID=291302 RepID=UPI0007A6F721|nr:PREDICTED: adhesion G protein-coupled receptor B2 isoform X12 [Miniopterus natalensis]